MSAFAVTENSVVLTLFEKDASINSAKGATPVTAYYALRDERMHYIARYDDQKLVSQKII